MSKYLKIVFYETPSYLAKRLYDAERNKDDGIVKYIIDAWIEWKKMLMNRFSMLITNEKEKGAPIILARVAKASNHKVSSPKVSDNSSLKILTPKQMLQRLPIALAQVKAGNTSENLLNELEKKLFPLYRVKEIIKKLYNNIMDSKKF